MVLIPKDRWGDLSNSNNYRGIWMSSCLTKLIEILNVSRRSDHLLTSDSQFAYKELHSTTGATSVVKECVRYFLNRGSPVFCCMLDASKAFDRVRYDALLSRTNMSPILFRLVMNIYHN